MGYSVEITLTLDGQELEVSAPAVVASGTRNKIAFAVELSEEWEGYEDYWVVLQRKHCEKWCRVEEGRAAADAEAMAAGGVLSVAVVAESEGKRLTSALGRIDLSESGIQ